MLKHKSIIYICKCGVNELRAEWPGTTRQNKPWFSWMAQAKKDVKTVINLWIPNTMRNNSWNNRGASRECENQRQATGEWSDPDFCYYFFPFVLCSSESYYVFPKKWGFHGRVQKCSLLLDGNVSSKEMKFVFFLSFVRSFCSCHAVVIVVVIYFEGGQKCFRLEKSSTGSCFMWYI